MAKTKKDVEVNEIQEVQDQPGADEKNEQCTVEDLKASMLEVGRKLCRDLMDGKARDEKTALTAIVEIYNAVHDGA